MTMRKVAWRRWAAASGATLALVALAATSGLSAETTRPSPGTERAWLGVYTQALTPELVQGSPADRAGVQKGDIITGFNARSVDSPEGLSDLVGRGRSGQAASLRIVRDGKAQSLNVKLAGRSEDGEGESMESGPHEVRIQDLDSVGPLEMDLGPGGLMRWMGRGRLGVRVEGLNPDLGSYFGAPDGQGVLVVKVMKDTPAEKAGLKAGDVITRVGDQAVTDAQDLVKALRDD